MTRDKWPAPEGGWLRLSEIGDPLADAEVRLLGFEPAGWRGWKPRTSELAERLHAADARRTDRALSFVHVPFSIPGDPVACTVCGQDAEPSTAGTPTCSEVCAAVLAHYYFDEPHPELYTRADGSGGRDPIQPITPARPRQRLSVIPGGSFSVERGLERLGSCADVLERHGHRLRGRMVFCPFHENSRTRAMSVYERSGKSRAHCHSCDWSGDALDLEAALAGEDVVTTIKRWGSS